MPELETTERHIPGASERLPSQPYRSSPIFTAETLPEALKREHRTKRGVWAVLHILSGCIRYCPETDELPSVVTPAKPQIIRPDQPHHVELLGPVTLRIDFFDHEPVGVV